MKRGGGADIDYISTYLIISGCSISGNEIGIPTSFTISKEKESYNIPNSSIYCLESITFKNGSVNTEFNCNDPEIESCLIEGVRPGGCRFFSEKKVEFYYMIGLIEFQCLYNIKETEKGFHFKLKKKIKVIVHELPEEE